MIKWLRLLTFKEFIQFLIYKVGQVIVKKSGFQREGEPIRKEIQELLNEGYVIGRTGKNICIEIPGDTNSKKYLIRPLTTDRKVFKQVIIDHEYMPMVELIKAKGQNDFIKKIIDAGSNVGMTSLFFKRFYPDAKIVSIEPDEANFIQQKENIRINRYESAVKLVRAALWMNNTDRLLISNDFRDGESWAKSVIRSEEEQGNKFIGSLTLKDVIKLFREGEEVDLLKIDIEGSEAELFESEEFVDLLKSSVKFLCLEIHDELDIRPKIYQVFSEINFTYHAVGETCFCVNNNLV